MMIDPESPSDPESPPTTPPHLPSVKLSVVEMVYFQQPPDQPIQVESRFGRSLTTREQPYIRHTSVGEDWRTLDCGWLLNNIGMMVVANDEGKSNQRIPTQEERADIASRILEITWAQWGYESANTKGKHLNCWIIHPGESLRAQPSDGMNMLIRCRKGVARYTLTAFPV